MLKHKCSAIQAHDIISDSTDPKFSDSDDSTVSYVLPNKKAEWSASVWISQQLQKRSVIGIGCFDGTFSLKVKTDMRPYKALPRHVANAL